jgi:hypothetical protein
VSAAARLVHDVGKYVARTARNLPDGTVDGDLIDMMVRDLYELQPGRRASRVFEDLAPGVPGIADVRVLFVELDALELRVRKGEQAAVRRAAGLACQIEQRLRALLGAAR